jgi:hypothetical protein
MAELVSSAHARCFFAFESLIRALKQPARDFQDQISPREIQNEFDKYTIWAGNVGAAHSGKRYEISLDYRLREASFLREQVSKLLSTLEEKISTAAGLIRGERKPFEEEQTEESDSEVSISSDPGVEQEEGATEFEDSPWEISSDSSNGDGSSLQHWQTYQKPNEPRVPCRSPSKTTARSELSVGCSPILELPRLVESIKFTITCLYRLPIRRPAPLDRIKHRTSIDSAVYQHFDVLYVKDKFPNLQLQAATRLGKMITRRRQILHYCEAHKQSLDVARVQPKIAAVSEAPPTSSIVEGGSKVTVEDRGSQATPSRLVLSQAASSHFTLRSKATTVRPGELKLLNSKDHMDTLFAPSFAESKSSMASSYAGKAIRISVPSRPKNDDGQELEQFECPYCLLTKNVSNDRRWKKHVLEDLQPYVCTYGDCELYDHFFESRDAWFKHEAQQHRTKWSCNVDGHMEYDSEGHFLLHMRADHDQNFDEAQFSLVKSMFRRPTNSLEGTCNLCDRSSKNLRSHVSRHLQQIAIFALPRVNETAGSGQAERDSRSSRYKKDNLDDCETSGSSSSSTDVLRDDQPVPNDSTSDTCDVEDDYNEGENIPDTITDQGWDDITDKFTKARERTFRLLRILVLEMNDESRNKMVALIKRLKAEPIVIMSDGTSTADALQNHAKSDAIIIGDAFGSSALNATIRQIRDVTDVPIVVIHESASTLGPIPNISDWTELYEPDQGDIEEALGSFCQWAPAPPHWRPATSNHMDSLSGAGTFTTGTMRLLRYEEAGRLTITSFDDAIPPYAILSHTWGPDAEEVTFADLAKGGGKDKPGYKKIRFCGEQAQRDGLQYFWVDTCCIDKTDKAELSLAILSMFRWYQNATKCYVYLSDVWTKKRKAGSISNEFTWEPAFRSSRWFTRGWTLQELLAPRIVEFFSEEWDKIGDKISLKALIKEITGIPHEALDGTPLSQFSVDERLRWKEGRVTQREEDRVYSLQGILDVELAPVYGEGAAGAFKRLKDGIDKLEICIGNIRHTDPRHDKKRIEDTKGGLLADSYRWVLDNTAFQHWQQDPDSRLLWVKGDPGKGKTMLLCGVINELQSSMPQSTLLSYFFCQATDARINNATSVLRGLLYMLVTQQPSLVSHVRVKHDHAGKAMFEDANAWVVLTEIFEAVLHDPSLRMTHLVIDALDECVTDLPKLLEFVAKQSSASSRVKWIVSSRNWPDIEAQLEQAGHKVKLSLELNAKSIAAAVAVFIQQKVDQLAQEKQYRADIRHAVLQHLESNADNTFLWVALVCQDLRKTPKWNVLKKLTSFPPGLDSLYKRMMEQISESDCAKICLQVLASTAILYRPVSVPELVALVEQLEYLDDLESAREVIGFCGSFLTLREDIVYFVHQSGKDFLFKKGYDKAFPERSETIHRTILSRSLGILSRTLHRDMYSLEALGYPTKNVKPPKVDPLVVSRYPCIYWINHLCDSKPSSLANRVDDVQVLSAVDEFLREKYLYWLEGLSLCKSVGKGVVSMEKLWSLVQVRRTRSTCLWFDLDANASRRCMAKIDLLSLFKTHVG